MKDINSFQLVGRLTKDATFETTKNGKSKLTWTIANNCGKDSNGNELANFFDFVLWGKLAESVAPYMTKGKQVVATGEMRQEKWQDKDGKNVSHIRFYVEDIQIVGGREENRNVPSSTPISQQMTEPEAFDDGDIPF